MPVMVATSEDRIAHSGGRRQGELPVLFHLMDVSRQRRGAEAIPVIAPHATSIVVEPKTPDAPISLAPAAPQTLLGPSPYSASIEAAWPAITEPPAPPPSAISSNPVSVECLQDAVSESPSAAPHSELAAGQAPVEEPPAVQAEPPRDITPRSLLTPRRRAKTPASEDWFATHGKFIAMAFVVALLGTIYFARTTRQQAAPATTTKESPLAEHKLDVQLPPQSTAATGAGSSPRKPTGTEAQGQIASTATESRVDLLPPTTPPNAAASASTANSSATRGADNLFVFPSSKPSDERIASRPQDTVNGQSSAARFDSPAQPSAPVMPAAYPATSSPALPAAPAAHSSFPQTPTPPLAAPGGSPGHFTQPAPSAPQAPTMPPPNHRSQFPLPPAGAAPQPQAWMPPPSGPTLPGPYQPQINTALGPRYERTGSGPY
jgi:hypothetical protein